MRTPIRSRIHRIAKTFALMYGKDPNAVFVPANLAPEFIAMIDDIREPITGEHTEPGGVVLDSYNGMFIKLCTGSTLGVGVMRTDNTTPLHNAIWDGNPDE